MSHWAESSYDPRFINLNVVKTSQPKRIGERIGYSHDRKSTLNLSYSVPGEAIEASWEQDKTLYWFGRNIMQARDQVSIGNLPGSDAVSTGSPNNSVLAEEQENVIQTKTRVS